MLYVYLGQESIGLDKLDMHKFKYPIIEIFDGENYIASLCGICLSNGTNSYLLFMISILHLSYLFFLIDINDLKRHICQIFIGV